LTAFKAITSSNADEGEIIRLIRIFIEVSSVLLLRMGKQKDAKHSAADFPAMIVFMDTFIEETPLLTREVLESCLPYALLRNEWKSIYAQKGQKKGAATETGAFD